MSKDRSGVVLPPGVLEPVPLDLTQASLTRTSVASIGKKTTMGVFGLCWCGFVLMHLIGNLSIFAGAAAFDGYGHKLASLGPLLIVAEAGLVVFLVLHVVFGILVTLENSAARPVKYAKDVTKGEGSLACSTMIWSGIAVFVFIVVHLINLKYGAHRDVVHEGTKMRDLYTLTIDLFQSPLYVVLYVAAVSLVGLHVSHGFKSGFRTLGLNHDKYTPTINRISTGFGILAFLGYASIPIWAYLAKGGAQ